MHKIWRVRYKGNMEELYNTAALAENCIGYPDSILVQFDDTLGGKNEYAFGWHKFPRKDFEKRNLK